MSAIPPPNIVASILQTGAAQRAATAEREADENLRASFSRELAGAQNPVELEIEATDADTRVHADAGGQGSAGRHDSHEPPAEHSLDKSAEAAVNADGHIDLTA